MYLKEIKENKISILLFFSFFFLCFNDIPSILQLNTVSGGFAIKASWYPLFGLLNWFNYFYGTMANPNDTFIEKNEKRKIYG